MKKANCILPLVILLLFTDYIVGQNITDLPCCLDEKSEFRIYQRLLQNKRFLEENAVVRGVITYVPVKFHLVGNSAGEDRVSEAAVLDMLCILNEEFLESEIQFYMEDLFSYVDNTLLFEHSGNSLQAIWDVSNSFKVANAVNIFITNNAGLIGSGGTPNTVGYYAPSNDCIFIAIGAAYRHDVLPHEMGHFFSLLHTFYGYESCPPCDWGPNNQMDSLACNATVYETMSGSNCETTADLICDTPPDYLFAFCASGCSFEEEVYDFEGTLIEPMESNMMAFFPDCADYEFTPDQNDVMTADLFSPERAYVNPGVTPNLDIFTGQPELFSPNQDEELPVNAFYFNWEEISGATHYLLEIDVSPSFNYEPYRKIYPTTEAFVTDYGDPNESYYWRVRAFNEYRTCPQYSETGEFETGNFISNISEIEAVNNWSVYPNPVSEKEILTIKLETNTSFDGSLRMSTITGKTVFESNQKYHKGAFVHKILTTGFPKGLYFISIKTKEGILIRKVVVD